MKINEDIAFFERGIIAGFEDAGLDKYAAAGFVDGYSDYVKSMEEIIKQAEELSGDPEYRVKLAQEIEKSAAGEGAMQYLQPIIDYIKDPANRKTLALGAGGGLAGLYLGSRNKKNPGMGGLLGGLAGAGAGAGLGHFLPQIIAWIRSMLGKGQTPVDKDTAAYNAAVGPENNMTTPALDATNASPSIDHNQSPISAKIDPIEQAQIDASRKIDHSQKPIVPVDTTPSPEDMSWAAKAREALVNERKQPQGPPAPPSKAFRPETPGTGKHPEGWVWDIPDNPKQIAQTSRVTQDVVDQKNMLKNMGTPAVGPEGDTLPAHKLLEPKPYNF